MLEKEEVTFEEFLDLEGNVYKVKGVSQDKVMTLDSHTHNYVKGYYKRHTLKTDGGCVVATYNDQICTICGTVILGSLYSTATYPVCPH